MRAVLRNRDFRLLFTGQAVSAIGDQIFPVAVTVHVLDHGGTVGELGLVLAARFASLVLFALLGGVWADRLPRVQVLVGADVTRLIAVLGLAAVMTGSTSVALLAPLVFVVGAGEAFFRPAYGALLPGVLTADELPQGNALGGATFHLASVVGPGLAGLLAVAVGARGAMLVDAGTFAVSLATLVRVREPERIVRTRQRVGTEMAEGIRAVRDRPWIASVLLMAMIQLLVFFAATSVLLPAVFRDRGDTAGYGFVLAVGAAGGLLGSLVAGHLRPRRRGLVGMLSLLLFATEPLALLADAPPWALGAAWFVSSLGLGPFLDYWETARQQDVPPELLARVISLDWMCSFALLPLGLAIVGPVVDAVGRTPVLWAAFVVAVVPPLVCLPVPGMLEFRTPTDRSVTGSPQVDAQRSQA
jgi:DHA3 family tetracycline resistance protein-like MFS transporter